MLKWRKKKKVLAKIFRKVVSIFIVNNIIQVQLVSVVLVAAIFPFDCQNLNLIISNIQIETLLFSITLCMWSQNTVLHTREWWMHKNIEITSFSFAAILHGKYIFTFLSICAVTHCWETVWVLELWHHCCAIYLLINHCNGYFNLPPLSKLTW